MAEAEELDAERIMERIRENVRRRRSAGQVSAPPGTPAPISDDGGEADLASLQSTYDVYHIPITSHRGVLGPAVVLTKKVLRRLLSPILLRQVAYNAANTRVVTHLKDEFEAYGRREAESLAVQAHALQLVRERLATLDQGQVQLREALQLVGEQMATAQEQRVHLREELLASQSQALQRVQEHVVALGQEQAEKLNVVAERTSRAERRLGRLLYLLAEGEQKAKEPEIPQKAVRLLDAEPEFDYFGFQERFRGSEKDVKQRQRAYVSDFRGHEEVLDIGCGRGEFLNLLQEAGIKAKGVDIDLDMVLHCQEKGLDVVRGEALAFLEALPDQSVGGIFSAQVIEHLEAGEIIRFAKLCHRKLQLGGLVIIETLNPENLFVHYRWFWMDPTHKRLVHPETVKFLFEMLGFAEVSCRFLPPADGPVTLPPLGAPGASTPELHRFNAATEYLNRLLYSSTDYAVIAKK